MNCLMREPLIILLHSLRSLIKIAFMRKLLLLVFPYFPILISAQRSYIDAETSRLADLAALREMI